MQNHCMQQGQNAHVVNFSNARMTTIVFIVQSWSLGSGDSWCIESEHVLECMRRGMKKGVIGSGEREKITDFGMSRLIDMNLPRMTPLTKPRETAVYMPPEILADFPHYSDRMDCFLPGCAGNIYKSSQEVSPPPLMPSHSMKTTISPLDMWLCSCLGPEK